MDLTRPSPHMVLTLATMKVYRLADLEVEAFRRAI
jgi:hypothetical protein